MCMFFLVTRCIFDTDSSQYALEAWIGGVVFSFGNALIHDFS